MTKHIVDQDMQDSGSHPDDTLLDQWRAELLDTDMARRLQAHVETCAHCQQRSGLAAAIVQTLDSQPHPRLRPVAAQRRIPGMQPVYRLGTAMAALFLVVGLSWQLNMQSPRPPEMASVMKDPQTADTVTDLEFYRWLEKNPQIVKQTAHEA